MGDVFRLEGRGSFYPDFKLYKISNMEVAIFGK